jgi:membrane-associated phospholipid phosphatase
MTPLLEALATLANLSPIIIYICGILVSIISGHLLPAIFTIFAIIIGYGANTLLKLLFQLIGPQKQSWMRPNPPATGCGLFSGCVSKEIGTKIDLLWGMPSGHAQILSFTTSFWILYIWRQSDLSRTGAIISTIILLILSWAIKYSRIASGCHNFEQILIGSIFGMILGISIYFILEKNKPQFFAKRITT